MNYKLILFCAFFIFSISLKAATATVDGVTWTYTVSNEKVTLGGGSSSSTAIRTSTSGAVTIPSALGGYAVVRIGDYAFYGCGLTSVTMPDSVTSIGGYAFEFCSRLTNVVIGSGVTSIGSYAFYKCSGLTSVTIPDSVTSIGGSAFYNCANLTSVTIPDSVTSIGGSAFYNCTNLTSVTIPDGVTSIGARAFCGCSGLTNAVIGSGVTSIGNSAFSGCSGLMSFVVASGNPSYKSVSGLLLTKDGKTLASGVNGDVSIPDGVTSIGGSAFSGCSGLTSVTIPHSVTSIGYSAFSGCSGLTSVTISDSVTSIEGSAFYNCTNLTSVTIPDGVTSIKSSAFSGCSGLTSVTIPDSVASVVSSAFSDCNSSLYDTNSIPGVKLVDGWAIGNTGSLSGHLDLTGVRGIGSSAFKNCSRLTSVTIPDSVASIGGDAFLGCSGLTNVVIGSGVTSIGSYAFYNCSRLTSVTMPGSVTSIGDYAFSGCSGLTSVTIPDGVTSIGGDAFSGCNSSLYATNSIPGVKLVDGWAIGNTGSLSGHLDLTGVRGIGSSAFYNCSGLTSVTIPDGVTSIGEGAFSGCSGLTSVTIPDGVTSIEYRAFYNCSGLTSVTIPDGVTSIGSSAFVDCTNLTSVTMPSSVTSIGHSAFYGCSSLVSVTIPDGVTSIRDSAFSGCRCLISVTIPEGVENIGDYAFNNCSSLIFAYVPEGLLGKLSANVFAGCHSDFAIFYCPYTMRDGGAASWRVDSGNMHGDGEQCLRSGAIGNEEVSWLEMTVPRAGRLSFWWKASSEHDGDSVFDGAYLSIDDEPMGGLDANSYALWGVAIGGEAGWTNVVLDIVGKGPHKIRWTYQKDEVDEGSVGDDCVWVSGIEFDPEPFSFAECLNDAELPVTTEGDLPWERIQESAQSHDGVASLRSGAIGNDQSSTLKIQVDGSGQLSFWWKVSSERTVRNKRHDGCSFLVDGVEKLYMDGTTNNWQMVTVAIEGEGVHELTWTYQKDASDNNEVGEDCAWLDEVVWRADLIPAIAPDASDTTVNAAVDGVGFADATVRAAIGGSAAEYNAFKTWADGVKGATGDALAGEVAVVANAHAAAAYLLGADRLFENEPTIEIGELSVATVAPMSGGEGVAATQMTVVVVVKDGERVVAVDAEKVAAMFEATGDLGDWAGAAKLMPTVTTTGIDANGKMTFVVTPGDGTASKAFLRIRR